MDFSYLVSSQKERACDSRCKRQLQAPRHALPELEKSPVGCSRRRGLHVLLKSKQERLACSWSPACTWSRGFLSAAVWRPASPVMILRPTRRAEQEGGWDHCCFCRPVPGATSGTQVPLSQFTGRRACSTERGCEPSCRSKWQSRGHFRSLVPSPLACPYGLGSDLKQP